MKVGFIGVGNMGGPMCRNIIRNTNHQVVVFDLSPDAVKACTDLGATAGTSIADVAAACDIVLTSLPTPKIVEDVTLGPDGIATHARPGSTFIDLSTNSPATARRVAAAMAEKGVAMLEAPVSGGTARATDGTIVIMVGGDPTVFEQSLPLLKSFSGEVIHLGEIGFGSVAKLINNMLAFCNSAAAAEALMMGKRAGIDLRKLDSVIRNASGMSAGYVNMANKAFAGNFQPTFALDLAQGSEACDGTRGRTRGTRPDRAAGDEPDAHGPWHGPWLVGLHIDGTGVRNRLERRHSCLKWRRHTFRVAAPLTRMCVIVPAWLFSNAGLEPMDAEFSRGKALAGKNQILVVEDDPLVSDIITAVLDQTYPITVTEDGGSALGALREGDVRLILLDCTLPGGVPPDLFTEADRCGTPIILMSGDPDRIKRVSDVPRPFIRKPFSLSGLMETIESVLANEGRLTS